MAKIIRPFVLCKKWEYLTWFSFKGILFIKKRGFDFTRFFNVHNTVIPNLISYDTWARSLKSCYALPGSSFSGWKWSEWPFEKWGVLGILLLLCLKTHKLKFLDRCVRVFDREYPVITDNVITSKQTNGRTDIMEHIISQLHGWWKLKGTHHVHVYWWAFW